MFTLPRGPWTEQQTHTGCEISEQTFVFSDNWTNSITPKRCDLILVKGGQVDCNENDLFPLETNTGQHSDSSRKTHLQMYLGWISFHFMNDKSLRISLSLSEQTHTLSNYNFARCLAVLFCILSSDVFNINSFPVFKEPVRIYYLRKTGIPSKLNCFLNRPHDKQQLASKFQLRKGLLPNTDINSFKISRALTSTTLSALFPLCCFHFSLNYHTCQWSHSRRCMASGYISSQRGNSFIQ